MATWGKSFLLVLLLVMGHLTRASAAPFATANAAKAQITVLYDAFGTDSPMRRDWGYSAFIEYGGKRILFDTGNNPEILARNAAAKHVDLSKLDFAVLSHRHGDHIGGLSYVLKINPNVKIYAPKEGFGVFRCRFARRFLSEGRFTSPRSEVFRGRCASDNAVRLCIAWGEFPINRQERRNRA